nr:hypothetical transcript [Hymenolepis microstoma]
MFILGFYARLGWFYWTIGGEDADRKASVTTLIFTAFFILGRYILPIPYWYVFFTAFNSEMHLILKPNFPSFTNLFISCPVLLDVLNIVWGIPIYGIAKKALITLGYVKQSRIATANGSVQYQSNGSVESVSNGKLHDH